MTEGDKTASRLSEFLDQVPDEFRESVERVLARGNADQERLLESLDAYTYRINAASRKRRDLDVNLAEQILRVCRELLERDWVTLSDEKRRLVQIACDYYVDSDDAQDDLESVFGFDDDALIVNLVLDAIGFSDRRLSI